MAHHKSAKKRIRQDAKKRLDNRSIYESNFYQVGGGSTPETNHTMKMYHAAYVWLEMDDGRAKWPWNLNDTERPRWAGVSDPTIPSQIMYMARGSFPFCPPLGLGSLRWCSPVGRIYFFHLRIASGFLDGILRFWSHLVFSWLFQYCMSSFHEICLLP